MIKALASNPAVVDDAIEAGGAPMTVWSEIRQVLSSSRSEWLTGGEIARAVRVLNPLRSEATTRALIGFYCINDHNKDSSPGSVYLNNPLLVTDDPVVRGKRYRLLTPQERIAFLAHPRKDLQSISYAELMVWISGGASPAAHSPPPTLVSQPVRPTESTPAVTKASPDQVDLILIGCVKSKLPGRHPAKNLYTSAMFRGRRAYAEASGKRWFVLSAEYGLVAPDAVIATYDTDLRQASPSYQANWSKKVLAQIDAAVGDLRGKSVEIHAGSAYRNHGLVEGLERRGAVVRVPFSGHRFGEQLSAYRQLADSLPPPSTHPVAPAVRERITHVTGGAPPARASVVAATITRDFMFGRFDLGGRAGAPHPGWESLPEYGAVQRLRALGATPAETRVFLTLVMALDRARDADRLWENAARLWELDKWVFASAAVAGRPFHDLKDVLAQHGVSQRHISDASAWRLILESLNDPAAPRAVHDAVFGGNGDTEALLSAVNALRPSGQPWFPFLGGPKVSVVWVRLLAWPGGARISGLDRLTVAVDVQVRKVSEYLGVTTTSGQPLESVRSTIEDAWRQVAQWAVGPDQLRGTAAALDPALWFFGKWGCTFCQNARRKLPIGEACRSCYFAAE